ncbi:hypothetical protein [Neobacillus drentensis]|uniref:hypothetical protein n=1 Tax=Neobacillus drentensis TaxID=220684 RepID=UPI002FFF8C26
MNITEVQSFLRDFHGEEATNFMVIKGNSIKKLNSHFNTNAQTLLRQFNDQDYEIYFVPNSGGYSVENITRFNCVFVDLDCGKDEHKNYYPMETVSAYKKSKIEEINRFKYQPSYVVETRNGLHVYWLLEDGATIDQFIECEERLISYFDADKVVKNPNRLLRLPNFNWCKDPENKFMVKIIQQHKGRYEITNLLDALQEITLSEKCDTNRKKCTKLLSIDATKPSYATRGNNLIMIRQRNAEGLQSILKPKGIQLGSHDEVYDYLKKQDLHELLGLHGTTFNCLFHDDKNPSAGIVINEDTGHHIYNCMSSSCGISLTIIQVVERLTNLNRVEALRFLRNVYKIDYQETDWQKEKKEILHENQRLIFSNELSQVYPMIDKMIRKYTVELSLMNQLALNHLQTEYFTDKQGNPIFFSSLRYLAQKCGKDSKRLSDKISLFTYLGLIRKVPEDEIPEFLLNKAKSEAAKKKQKYLVGFYSIPPYGEETFKFTKEKISEYKQHGFTMRGWGRELLLRTLGEEESNRVFPQMEAKEIPERNNELTSEIERVALMLIEHKGFTTEKEILYFLTQEHGKQSIYEKQIKRTIPDLINKYCLNRQRLNKALKEQLGIEDMSGYPIVIYK